MKNRTAARVNSQGYFTCAGCGKRAYPSRAQAKRIARQMIKCTGEKLSDLAAYPCQHSPTPVFHVGHVRRRTA